MPRKRRTAPEPTAQAAQAGATLPVTRRITDWADDFNLAIQPHDARPDSPAGDVVYLVKDLFTTRDGSEAGRGLGLTIVERAAKLICTTPEFDDLAKEVGLGSHKKGVTDPKVRAQLRAELDGMIAHLYGLTESEFAHILSTFPLVAEEVKSAAMEEFQKRK